jgi:hypothetical protein
MGQEFNVGATATKRRHGDRKNIQPVKRVFPETPSCDLSMANCYFVKLHGMQHCCILFFMLLLISNALLVLARHSCYRARIPLRGDPGAKN